MVNPDMPLTPPIMGGERPTPPMGNMPLGGETVVTEAEHDGFRRRMFESRVGRTVAGALVAGGVLAGVYAATSGEQVADKQSELAAPAINPELIGQSAQAGDVCPNGIFDPTAPMALASEVRPGDLHARPAANTSKDKDFFQYMFGNKDGEKGVTCALPTDLAVYQKVFDSWAGGESGFSKPFGDLLGGANELAAFYGANPKDAEKALKSEAFVSFVNGLKNNDDIINAGTYFKISLVDGVITQTPVDLAEMAPGTVRTLGDSVWINDSKFAGNGQMVIQANGTGELYILHSLGDTPITPPETTTSSTSTTTSPEGSDANTGDNQGQEGNNNGKKGSKNGGGGDTGKNQGNGGTGGSAGPKGDNPEAGPLGVTESPGEGGQPGAPGNPGTPRNPGTPGTSGTPETTPTTKKPTPTTAKPPVTVPPTSPPTAPPTTGPNGGPKPSSPDTTSPPPPSGY